VPLPPAAAAAALSRAAPPPPLPRSQSRAQVASAASAPRPPPLAAAATAAATHPVSSVAPPRHRARVLDGRALAAAWCADIRAEVSARSASPHIARPPGLAVVLVGDCVDSMLYVRNKRDACAGAGISFRLVHLPESASQAAVAAAVRSCVADRSVHGVLVQLPLPSHLDEEAILETVSAEKDVDGFHPLNAGRLSQRGRTPLFVPCTPKGVLEMLRRAGVPVAGASAVVLGNSNTVGMPLSMLLRDCGAATVTVCHAAAGAAEDAAAAEKLAAVARTADILVAAVGRPGLVKAHWVKPGAAVLDVGINAVPIEDGAHPGGMNRHAGAAAGAPAAGFGCHVSMADLSAQELSWRVVGDVAFEEVCAVAGAVTPVPGGVGPMTIAALLDNVLHAWLRAETDHYSELGCD
jgi:5,10-methylene-tetrahydrofolate dehydrogenase/methenyl tetrahydrofolate cyclohydrolase